MPFTVAHKPTQTTRADVKLFYGAGVSEANIANHLGILPETLRKHYRKELDHGSMEVGKSALKRIVKDIKNPKSGMAGTVASIFAIKNAKGFNWADKIDRTGDGPTVQIGNGAKIVILPSNGRERIAQERLLARPPLMIEATPVEADEED